MVFNRRLTTRLVLWSFCAVALLVPLGLISGLLTHTLHGQTGISNPEGISDEMRAKLEQRGDIMLRDTTLVEAMFIVEEHWGVNIVISNEAKEAVNGAYKDAPLHEVLDTLLSSQGYGYRVVGDSLVVMKLDQIGTKRPLFETVRIPLEHIPPDEVVDLIKILLSPDGAAHAVPTAKSIVVMDYPERIEQVRSRIRELDEAAEDAIQKQKDEEERSAEEALERAARTRTPQALAPSNVGAAPEHQAAVSANQDDGQNGTDPDRESAGSSAPESQSSTSQTGSSDAQVDSSHRTNSRTSGDSARTGSGFQLSLNPLVGAIRGIAQSDRSQSSPEAGAAGEELGPAVPDLEVAFFAPRYVEAAAILDSLSTMVSEYGQVTAVAEENRIVAIDQPAYLKRIGFAIQQLDVARPQVRISAVIFDASLEDLENIGLNINHTARGRNLDSSGNAQDQISIGTMLAPTPGAAAMNGNLMAMSLSQNFDITAVVNMLRTSNRSKLLADPTVVVMHRESARIEIVTEIPYQQLTESAQGGSIGTTAFREAGVTLEVSPHICGDGTVRFVVTPQFSVLTGFTEEENQPIIARRNAQTVVTVADQQTLVIGGLRQRSKVRNRASIPYLSDIKYIGPLFRQKGDEIRESELLVFLTPTIISPEHFGTCREQRVYEQGKCELEKITEEHCERCKPPEDPTVYTNYDFAYGSVHVNVGPATEVEIEELEAEAKAEATSPKTQSRGPSTRLPAARRGEPSGPDRQQQLVPPLVPPLPVSTRRNAAPNVVEQHSAVGPPLEGHPPQRGTVHPARAQPAQTRQAQGTIANEQRVTRNPSAGLRYTKLPPVETVRPSGAPPADGHRSRGGLARPTGKLNVIRKNAAEDPPHEDVPRPAADGAIETQDLDGYFQL